MHDRSLLARESVEKRRLSDVRPADDRDGSNAGPDLRRTLGIIAFERWRRRIGRLEFWQLLHDLVEQIADAAAVQRAHHRRLAEPEACELPGIDLAALRVDLVRDHEDRSAVPADQLGHGSVLPGHSRCRVEDKQHEVRLTERTQGLLGHLGVERVSTLHDPAGVHDEKRPSVPLALELQPIARHAWAGLDDGHLPAGEPVHERRLADVRPPDHRHDRQPRA